MQMRAGVAKKTIRSIRQQAFEATHLFDSHPSRASTSKSPGGSQRRLRQAVSPDRFCHRPREDEALSRRRCRE